MSEHHVPEFEDRVRVLLARAAEAIPADTDLTARVRQAHAGAARSTSACTVVRQRSALATVAAVLVVVLLAGVLTLVRPRESLLSAGGAIGAPTATAMAQVAARPTPYPPLRIKLEADRMVLTSPDQMCTRTLVADIVAGTPSAVRWNTPNGTIPASVARQGQMQVIMQRYLIYKVLTFAHMDLLRDRRQAPTQQFVSIGGQVGQDTYSIDGEPQLIPGARYVAVFDSPSSSSRGFPGGATMLLSFAYPVDAHGMVLFQAAGNPNEPGTGTLDPEIKFSLTSLKQTLAACKA